MFDQVNVTSDILPFDFIVKLVASIIYPIILGGGGYRGLGLGEEQSKETGHPLHISYLEIVCPIIITHHQNFGVWPSC
jgi:hypothetical protein